MPQLCEMNSFCMRGVMELSAGQVFCPPKSAHQGRGHMGVAGRARARDLQLHDSGY